MDSFSKMLENLVSVGGTFPGSQKNRFSSEPIENVKTLKTKAMETVQFDL